METSTLRDAGHATDVTHRSPAVGPAVGPAGVGETSVGAGGRTEGARRGMEGTVVDEEAVVTMTAEGMAVVGAETAMADMGEVGVGIAMGGTGEVGEGTVVATGEGATGTGGTATETAHIKQFCT